MPSVTYCNYKQALDIQEKLEEPEEGKAQGV